MVGGFCSVSHINDDRAVEPALPRQFGGGREGAGRGGGLKEAGSSEWAQGRQAPYNFLGIDYL